MFRNSITVSCIALVAGTLSIIQAQSATGSEQADKQNKTTQPLTAKQVQNNVDTAKAVNQLPGVHVEAKDLEPPAEEEAIHGFHPIKKMLQPVVKLEKNSTRLQQQIMKLEGPIASLQTPMLGLHKKMTSVEQKMGAMQNRIVDVGSKVDNVGEKMGGVGSRMQTISTQITAVRGDLDDMHRQIAELNGPIKDLHKPLAEVAEPLRTVEQKLEKLAALITTVLFAIVVATVVICVGTPIAAVLVYKNRKKLFPDIPDQDFPVAKATSKDRTLSGAKG